MKACHRCKAVWEEPGQPGFNNTCGRCGMSLHSCMNCTHHVSKGSVRCLVEEAALVQDPSSGNRCNHFEFTNNSPAAPTPTSPFEIEAAAHEGAGDPASARKKWAQLFGDA